MSFFKDLKDETLEEGAVLEEAAEETDDLFEAEETEAQANELYAEEVDASILENLFVEGEEAEEDEESIDEEYEIDEPAEVEVKIAEPSSEDTLTIITKGTTINGSIVSDGSLNVMGTINGDIECIGKLSISGSVVGNSVASEVFVNAKRLDGNIDSDGSVKIGLGTVVVGDIKAGSAVVAGAIKGELDVKGPVIIDSTAIIKGNIKAKAVQMNNGAVIDGFCSLAYADVDIDGIFE